MGSFIQNTKMTEMFGKLLLIFLSKCGIMDVNVLILTVFPVFLPVTADRPVKFPTFY